MSRDARPTDAAIVGMACLFPGAADLTTYWRNVVGKVDAVCDPPAGSDADVAYDPDSRENDTIYCKRGGYLGELARFDPLAYGVMPKSVDGGEPDQYLALRVAHAAMDDGRYLDRGFDHERAEVIIGRGTYINRGFTNVVQHGLALDQALALLRRLHPEHTDEELAALKRERKAALPPFNADMAAGLVPNVMSGRIANRLDLRGANYTLDAACASSLVAVDRAMQDLRDRRCDLALVGGVHCSTPAPILMIFCQLGALSRSGTMRPFDRRADGTLLGEGAGFVVLRRLEDAERDGDRIYAVVRAVGTASDGRGLGMLAPRVEGEVLALQRAYADAGVSPRTVGLLEAHGTGTPVGDATEIEALTHILGERDGESPWCALGCVKSMISHLIPAAGIAGMIKVALSLHHKLLPPTLHCEEPNPALGIERTPLYLNTEARPWIHGGPAPRRGGIDAFGFGGINTHALLEEHGSAAQSDPLDWDAEVLVVEAGSRAELIARTERLVRFLADADDVPLLDVAAALNRSLVDDRDGERLAIVAATARDARARLSAAIERLREHDRRRLRDGSGTFHDAEPLGRAPGALAMIFPGEGSQYPGMLADLCIHFPEARACFDAMDRTFIGRQGQPPPSASVFPLPGTDAKSAAEHLLRMDGAGESLFAAHRAMFAALSALGVRPDAVLGHSTGEYAALLAAGAVSFGGEEDLSASTRAIHSLYIRTERDGEIPRASLIAVASADPGLVAAVVEEAAGELFVAMDNCPHQVVLCGEHHAVDRAAARLRDAGGVCTELPFDRPYHTPQFEAFARALEQHFAELPFSSPQLALWSCATAQRFPNDPVEVRRLALAQWSRPVRFRETVEAMYDDGIRIFVECGPRGNLTAFVEDTLRRRPHLAVASDAAGRPGLRQLVTCLAQLAVHRVPIDFAGLYARRRANAVDLDAYDPPRRQLAPRLATAMPRIELERVPGEISAATRRDSIPQPLQPAEQVRPEDTGLEGYFATMERFLEVQRTVMEAFIGAAPAAPDARASAGVPTAPVELTAAAASPVTGASPESNGARPGSHGARNREEVEAALRALISERTGYPPSAIQPRLNLEADLGVDSIKRVEILETYRAQTGDGGGLDLDQLAQLRTIHEIAEAIARTDGDARAALDEPAGSSSPHLLGPLITAVETFDPGRAVTATCELDLEEHLFLRDHTLETGAIAVEDERLLGLPIMPLTFSMELLAEGAQLLRPGDRVVAMRDVRATRWVTLPDDRLSLEVRAWSEEGAEVRAELRERGGGDAPVLTATLELAPDWPSAPAAQPLALTDEQPSRSAAGPLYGGTSMFHGPAFQAVRSIDRSGGDGIEATLERPSAALLLRSEPQPAFVLDPVLLDAMGQVVAYWVADHCERAVNIFPFSLAHLALYAPPTAADTSLTCRARVRHINDRGVRSDVELIGSDGGLLATITAWEDRRMDLPAVLREFLASPRDAMLSRAWDVLGNGVDGPGAARWQARILDSLASELLEAQGGIWLGVLAHAVLARGERQRWRELRDAPGKRRREWLRGRIVSKDAVRQLVAERVGARLCPADVEIRAADAGRPEAIVSALDGGRVTVTISHAAETAVALAGVDTDGSAGIDIEPIRELAPETRLAAFAPREAALLTALSGDDGSWPMRMWCVKEAAGKASGRGLDGDPRRIEVVDVDATTGLASVALADGARLSVHTGVEDGMAYAACVTYDQSEVST